MITKQLSSDEKTVTISVSGKFDHYAVRPFVQAYESYPEGQKFYVVNLEEVKLIDSSAIGALLHLSEYANRQKLVTLHKPNKAVTQSLHVACLNKLFEIDVP